LDFRKYSFKLNKESVAVEAPPAYTLLEVLRNILNLTGTKDGCSKGECGACTVMMNGKAVNACLTIMEQVQEAEIVTIEGLAKDPTADKILSAFVEEGAVQCGYCTPGLIMASLALLSKNPMPTVDETKEALRGNLCRCTGYSKVVRAVLSARR
jgi:aerobic-type carbon monoxide dehydrogenase small subunit (CoxS/CutS family)